MGKKIRVVRSRATAQQSFAETSLAAAKPWLKDMNQEQLEAIHHQDGPARLFAPAGSGKTRVVTHRIARIIAEGVDPSRMLALTFSRKAADEMEERAKKLGIYEMNVGTWHRFCLRVLKTDRTRYADWAVGDPPRTLIRDIVGHKDMKWNAADVNLLRDFISRCKACLEKPGSDAAMMRAGRMFGDYDAPLAIEVYEKHDAEVRRKELLPFDDMLVYVAEHLEDEENRRRWQSRYDYVLQDEAQDENPAQKRIAWLLAHPTLGGHGNYMVIGDVFQSIYCFREATPDSMVNFEREWPGAKTYWLPLNYRSADEIIAAANNIVMRARMPGFEPRPMVPTRGLPGGLVVAEHKNSDDEARGFASHVLKAVKAGDAEHQDFCVLYRVNAQSRAVEDALIGARIPYVVVGGVSFYERKEIRDLLAYLRIGEGRGELDDVRRCINAPFRYLGKETVAKVATAADQDIDEDKDEDMSSIVWADLVRKVVGGMPGSQQRQRDSAAEWAEVVDMVADRIGDGLRAEENGLPPPEDSRPSQILDDIVKRTRYVEWLTKEDGTETVESSPGANVRELVRLAERFATSAELLDYIEKTLREARNQREDRQAGGNRVLLMNVHKSKGLEWRHVWIVGFNEGYFPHPKGDQEEERRVAYVAVTRARDTCTVSHVRTLAFRDAIKDAHRSRFLLDAIGAPNRSGGENAPNWDHLLPDDSF